MSQIQKLRLLNKGLKDNNVKEPELLPAKFIQDVAVLGDEALFSSCPVCNFIFEKGQTAVQCGNMKCEALYHESCFQKLKEGDCKQCDVKLHLY